MFLRTLTVLFLLCPGLAYSSEPLQDVRPKTTFQSILALHEARPFDFIKLATEAAQLRADYSRVALNLLRSETLTLPQRFEFARSLNPSFDDIARAYSQNEDVRKNAARELPTYGQIHNLPELIPPFNTSDELQFRGQVLDISRNYSVWDFFARSLLAYGADPESQTLEYSNQLLLELLKACDYADSDVKSFGEAEVDGYCRNRLLIDEAQYARCIFETVLLHTRLVRNFSEKEILVSELALSHLVSSWKIEQPYKWHRTCILSLFRR
jgi:hypothetical protein